MSDGHLFLSVRGCVDYAAGLVAWHDAAHGSLLLLSPRSRSLRQVALDSSVDPFDQEDGLSGRIAAVDKGRDPGSDDGADRRVSVLYEFGGDKGAALPPIESARLSVDSQFLALQTSDIEVQVVHRATRETYWVLCKSKGGNRILSDGVLWNTHSASASSSQDLFLVTKRGIEQYRVSSKRRNCRLHRAISAQVHAHWYAPSHNMLFVSTGSRGTELVPYLLRGSSVEKLPRLVFSSPVLQQDLFLAAMYGALYVVYSDMRTSKLLLYLVDRSKVTCVRSLNLMLPPGTALKFSVVDNLLVCHSLDFNVSLFFDVRCDGSVNDPFSAPLPVSLLPPGCQDDVDDAHAPLLVPESHPLNNARDNKRSGDSSASYLQPGSDGSDDGDENDDDNAFDQQVRTIRRAISVGDLHAPYMVDESVEAVVAPPAPTSNPIPLKQRSSRKLPRAMTVDESTMKHTQHQAERRRLDSSLDQSVFSRWQFLSPNLVQRSSLVTTGVDAKAVVDSVELVRVRKLQVNLGEICRSAAHHREILPFLLRRGDDQLAKRLALKLVREHIVEQLPHLSTITSLLSFVQTLTPSDIEKAALSHDRRGDSTSEDNYYADDGDDANTHSSAMSSVDSLDHHWTSSNGTPREVLRGMSSPSTVRSARTDEPDYKARLLPVRNRQGFIHIFQSDLFRHVWYPLLQDSTFAKSGKLSVYISEYLKNLRQNGVPIESITYVALAQSFIDAGEPQKLYQYLHYHVLSDSRDLADALVRHGAEYPSLMQVGLDMYFRLGAINGLVYSLLDIGETDRAISISYRNLTMKEHNAHAIPAAVFFDACVRSMTSEGVSASRFHASQKLNNLLLFLQIWDPDALQRPHPSSPSRLAQTVAVPFPDHLVSNNHRDRFRSAFGFTVEYR